MRRPLKIAQVFLSLPFGMVAVMLLTAPPVQAHHSNSIYDLQRTISLEGVVTRYEWKNPHVYVYVRRAGEPAGAAAWVIEASPPTLMSRRGFSASSFSLGDHVIVEVNPSKDASRLMALGVSIRKDDGTVLNMRDNAPLFASPVTGQTARSLAGTWFAPLVAGNVTRQFIFGPDSWPLTEKGSAAVADYDDSTNPNANCIAYTAPFSMVFPDLKLIEIDGDTIRIRSGLETAERIIHLNTNSHDGAADSNQGHSIGNWEGSILVVDTTHFTDRTNGNAFKLPSSRRKHLVERFEISSDGKGLAYRFELEDPEYFAEPLTAEVQWRYSPDEKFVAEGCDVENARRYLGR